MRYFITKSKSGHYTVTARDHRGVLVHREEKLPHLQAARNVIEKHKETENARSVRHH